MALEIVWTKTAEIQLSKIIEYLESNRTEREIKQFFTTLEKGIETIRTKPDQHKKSLRKEGAYEYQLSQQTTVFYVFDDKKATVLLLWPNRMNPENL